MKPRKKAKGKTVKFSGHPQEVCRAVCQRGVGGGGGKGNAHKKVTGMWVWLKPKSLREISVWSVSGQLNRVSLILWALEPHYI